jgi:hypothetical protein
LVYSIYDSTEEAIKKMIEASQKIINEQNNTRPVNERFKLQIKTLQNAPREPDKLERLLGLKERQKEEAMHIEDTQRLVTEIEMLKVVLYLVHRRGDYSSTPHLCILVRFPAARIGLAPS